jgi:hypothetical protein
MKISEGWLDNIENLYKGVKGNKDTLAGFSAFKNWQARRKSGLSKEQQLAYDNFVKNFVNNGANAINTAIKAGLLDPRSNVLSGNFPTLRDEPSVSQQQTQQSGSRQQRQPRQPTQQRQPRKQQAQPGLKPTMRQDKETGQWKPIVVPLDGINYTKTKQGWINDKNQLANPDYQVLLDKLLAQSLSEAIQYIKMQRLYESLINEEVKSISQWTRDHFIAPYLKGIDLSSGVEQINTILQNLPNSYANNTLKDDLAKIADIAWAIEMANQARKSPGTY